MADRDKDKAPSAPKASPRFTSMKERDQHAKEYPYRLDLQTTGGEVTVYFKTVDAAKDYIASSTKAGFFEVDESDNAAVNHSTTVIPVGQITSATITER